MRVARTFPNKPRWLAPPSVSLLRGSSKFGWFKTLVKLDSNLNAIRSVTWNLLLRPRFQVTVPGPTRDPTLALPKRPMTLHLLFVSITTVPGVKSCPAVPPGQANTFGFHHCVLVWRTLLGLPARSGRLKPKLAFPEESYCMKGVSKEPRSARKIVLSCQPPNIPSTTPLALIPPET